MHQGLIACPPNASLGEVAAMLDRHHIHAVIVADNPKKPLGIISDFDLLAGEWLSVDDQSLEAMRRMTAHDLMTSPIETLDVSTSIEDAAGMMVQKKVHRMVVIENDAPSGVVSISDFVANIASREKARRDTVGNVMSDAFLVCRDQTPIISAARTMTQAGWRSVVVVDSQGKPLGVVTGNDLMKFAGKRVEETLTVSEVMSRELLTVDMNASLQEAADLMVQNHKHRVSVVDKDDPGSFPLGVISSFDIVAEMARPGSIWQG